MFSKKYRVKQHIKLLVDVCRNFSFNNININNNNDDNKMLFVNVQTFFFFLVHNINSVIRDFVHVRFGRENTALIN